MGSITRYMRPLVAVTAVVLTFAASPAEASKPAAQEPSVIASFEGGWIRLADGWGEAQACTSDGLVARCYRSEAEMDAVEGGWPPVQKSGLAPLVDCALPALRIYRGGSWGGNVLQLTARYTVIDLAPHGFDNDTSSYTVGPCAARFYDTNSGGTLYPGTTSAGASSASMSSGWDNRVSSVYIS